MSRSIYWKITVPLAALVLLATSLLSLYMIDSTRNTQIGYVEAQLANEAKLVANITTSGFADPARTGNLNALARSIGNEIGARVTLISTDGTVLGDTEENPASMENHASRPEVAGALATGIGQATRYSATLHEGMLYVAVPVKDQGKTLGVARVALPLSSVEGPVNTAAITILGALAVGGLLVILAAAIIARMVTRPVRHITRAAEAIAAGKLEQQIPIRTSDEIGRLGRAFNEMSANVRNTMTAISAERARLVAVLSSLSDGVVLTDSQRGVVLANPAAERLFNFKEVTARGKPLIEAIHDHEIDGVVRKCLETAHEQTAQVDSTAGRFIRAIAVPITTGGASGALILLQDLTELRSLQTMRREFLANISHELRTPLAAIKAIGDTLRDGAIDDRKAAADFLDRLDVEVDGMTQMMTELIELSRIETGKIKLKLEPTSLNPLAQEVVARLNPQADRKKVSLSAELSPELPNVMADRDRIRQVILNIVHNAIKFTPAGGTVVVSTRLEGQAVVTQVADTGIGISKADLPHIFERFFKADKSRSTSGTGLGLAIAKHIVQSHGGTVWVKSEDGKGSIFGFTLPVSPVL